MRVAIVKYRHRKWTLRLAGSSRQGPSDNRHKKAVAWYSAPMKVKRFFVVILFGCFSLSLAGGVISVTDGRVRASIPGQQGTVAYMQISNAGEADCRLIAVDSDVAGRVEIHEHLHSQGQMRMREIKSLVIPAESTRTFQPGGLHLMLLDINRQLQEGDKVTFVFKTDSCGEIHSRFPVERVQ